MDLMQGELFDSPPFSPIFPSPTSLAGEALRLFLTGRTLTRPEFQSITGSWRLSSFVCTLRKLGWPVETIDIASPTDVCN